MIKNIWYRIEHRLHWLRHRELHAGYCVCKGTGKWTPPGTTR